MKNIVLVGFMGTGKTTVGMIVAERLGMTFVDMDAVIEQRAGKDISRIFADDGEQHFRSIERELVKELSGRQGLVIGTGGGIVLNSDNVHDYGQTGLLVCLSASPSVILERVSTETHRPLLEDGEKGKRILEILAARKELYGAIPHQIDTTDMEQSQVVTEVEELYSAIKSH